MERKIIKTADGSTTIFIKNWNEHYHSKHGAIQEANHVFIKNGLHKISDKTNEIRILEIGFGTGLNTFITLLEALKNNIFVTYTGVEAYPVEAEEVLALNYVDLLNAQSYKELFNLMHSLEWEKNHTITSNFTLHKQQKLFSEIADVNTYNLIYFDAFGARVQPELWTEDIFKIIFIALQANGILVTYAAKGSVRRAMQAVGFMVERLPGPPGKREMLRATKVI